MNLRIGTAETDDFLNWTRRTIRRRSNWNSVRPYDLRRNAVVLSFDAKLTPFLGNSYGWNRGEQKTYFLKTPVVLEHIRQIMLRLPDREMGGRVFIDNKRSYYVDLSSRERKIYDLTWPKGIDVVSEVRASWLKLPRRSHMTLQIRDSTKGAQRRANFVR
jgi:hypothetical protein